MSDEKEHPTPEEGGAVPSWGRRLLRYLRGPVAAALLGALLGVICRQVPEDYRGACEIASRILPASCSTDGGKAPPRSP